MNLGREEVFLVTESVYEWSFRERACGKLIPAPRTRKL